MSGLRKPGRPESPCYCGRERKAPAWHDERHEKIGRTSFRCTGNATTCPRPRRSSGCGSKFPAGCALAGCDDQASIGISVRVVHFDRPDALTVDHGHRTCPDDLHPIALCVSLRVADIFTSFLCQPIGRSAHLLPLSHPPSLWRPCLGGRPVRRMDGTGSHVRIAQGAKGASCDKLSRMLRRLFTWRMNLYGSLSAP